MKRIVLSAVVMAAMTTEMLTAAVNDGPLMKPEEPLLSFEDRLHFYGDARLRHQEVQRDDKDNSYEERYRIRFGMTYEISDDLIFEAQVSSGRDDPTSGNVNVKDGISIEQFKIDVLDIEYKFDNAWLRAGKSKHFFYRPMKTQLIWDNDIRPEGISYGYDNGDRFTAVIAKVHRIELEDDPNTDDIYFISGQYVHQKKHGDMTFNLGGGFHYYDGIKGNTSPYPDGPLGNTYTDGTYDHNYAITELMGEVRFKEILGKPFYLATTLAYNVAVSDHNFGYDLSVQWGDVKNNYDWRVGYTYRDIQRDAVFGAHNDSDFIAGGTDGRGHIVTAKMQLAKHVDIGGHFQWAQKYTDSAEADADYNRIMLDLVLKF